MQVKCGDVAYGKGDPSVRAQTVSAWSSNSRGTLSVAGVDGLTSVRRARGRRAESAGAAFGTLRTKSVMKIVSGGHGNPRAVGAMTPPGLRRWRRAEIENAIGEP
jgi:hypothetical protein